MTHGDALSHALHQRAYRRVEIDLVRNINSGAYVVDNVASIFYLTLLGVVGETSVKADAYLR